MASLYGGPSLNYNYGKELDPTEQQYFQEQALQQSLQQQQFAGYRLGQSNYNVEQSYSQNYLQRQRAKERNYSLGNIIKIGVLALELVARGV